MNDRFVSDNGSMKESALDHIVCLSCRGALSLGPERKMDPAHPEEVLEGELACGNCGNVYQVAFGVPRMLAKTTRETALQTGKSFAADWKAFPRMDERYRQQFFDWVSPVGPEFLKDKLVLECGCGKGRHAKIVSESGAAAIVAVDIGEAIDVAYKNVGHMRAVHLVQADIENMPLKKEYDFAFSVGVLHHMDYPVNGFLSLAGKLKEDGSALAWVYGRENNWWLIRIVNPVRVKVTSKLPPAVLMVLSGIIAAVLMVISKTVVYPWVMLQKQFHSLPKLYYQDYLAYIARFDFSEFHHIVFDHLVAPVANYVSREYFSKWFSEAGLPPPVIRWHNRNSWTGFSSHNQEVLEAMRNKITTVESRDL